MNNTNANPASLQERRDDALHYFTTLVDVARESFLILDPTLKVLSANDVFYESFHVSKEDTVGTLLYRLGNGQWDIPELRELLEDILPQKKAIRDYDVTHTFESIGSRTMLLNARQIDSAELIVLAIEDITHRKQLEGEVARYAAELEHDVDQKTHEHSARIHDLELLNKSMIGREMKMVELKNEIGDLSAKLADCRKGVGDGK